MKIDIQTPCYEKWNKMTPQANGRFCGSCQKTVVDFSVMNKEEITSYFSKKGSQSVCGRFKTSQLSKSRPLKKRRNKLGLFIAAICSFLVSKVTYTQGKPYAIEDLRTNKQVDTLHLIPSPKKNLADTIHVVDTMKQIVGRIVDEKGNPIPMVKILINDSLFCVLTDTNGNFKFSLLPVYKDSVKLTFRSLSGGYNEIIIYLRKSDEYHDLGEITMKEILYMTLGMVTIDNEFSNKSKLNLKLLRIFR